MTRMTSFQVLLQLLWLLAGIGLSSCFVSSSSFLNSHAKNVRRAFSMPRASASAEDILFNTEFSKSIAQKVQKKLKLPLVPGPVATYMIQEAIEKMKTELKPATLAKVMELVQTESTESKYDDMTPDEIDDLASQIAKELNGKIDVPVLDEEQEYELLRKIVNMILLVMTKSEGELRKEMIKSQLKMSRHLLGGAESREKLVDIISSSVDIPLLDEKQERELLYVAISSCAQTLETLLPPELLETLQGEPSEEIKKMKAYLVVSVNERIDIPGLSEEQEKTLIEEMVDILLDSCVDGTEAEFLLLSPEEQRDTLEERRLLLLHELEMSKRRFEREQKNLSTKVERIDERLKKMPRRRRIMNIFRRKK